MNIDLIDDNEHVPKRCIFIYNNGILTETSIVPAGYGDSFKMDYEILYYLTLVKVDADYNIHVYY